MPANLQLSFQKQKDIHKNNLNTLNDEHSPSTPL